MHDVNRRNQLIATARRQPEVVVDQLLEVEAQNKNLLKKLRAFQDRLALNSTNSSKPPSSDGLAKPASRNLREKTGRKPGGQPGHPGHTLQPVKKANVYVVHVLKHCTCGACSGVSLQKQPVIEYERRQVFDLPPMRLTVTEHQAEIKCCPVSGRRVTAAFPDEVTAPTQYGTNFRAFFVYCNNEHFLPFERLQILCHDLFGQPLSMATLTQANLRAYESLAPVEDYIAESLQRVNVLHVDESGIYVNGDLHWLHVACTSTLTHYGIHPRRGVEAMKALGILPQYCGWLIHDHMKSYYKFIKALHALCNQHLLRELKFLHQEHNQRWAQKLSEFLIQQKNAPQTAVGYGKKEFKRIHTKYKKIIREGRLLHPRRLAGEKRTAQSKAANLLDRLQDFELCVLAFLIDPAVPFTNNQAERDIRMIKVKQKISGGFRTIQGARIFARIRSYLSTCRKQGFNLWDATQRAVSGNPFMSFAPASGP